MSVCCRESKKEEKSILQACHDGGDNVGFIKVGRSIRFRGVCSLLSL